MVRVDAGVKTGDLAEWLHARGKSLGYALMGFRLPTIAGAVATGSHGSSPRFDSVLASRVRSDPARRLGGDAADLLARARRRRRTGAR